MKVSFRLGLLLVAGFSTSAARADVRAILPVYERYVAIDGACAWPQLTRLPSGEIAALIWPESNHGLTEGSAECWISPDQGVTWSRAGVPVPSEPGTNRMNLASGLAADGSLVVLASGWDRVRPKVAPGQPLAPAPAGPLRGRTRDPIPARSQDGGRTWTQFPAVAPEPGTKGATLIPYGAIYGLPDGKLGVMFYGASIFFFTSADGGKSWQKKGQLISTTVPDENRTHNETAWIPLENGDLYAASRTFGDHVLEGYRSRDGGATWVLETILTQPSQHPASLMRLPDGRVLLSYGMRNVGQRGINIRVADATATTWSDPLALVDFEDWAIAPGAKRPTDGGYPSTIALPDGMLVTAYYSAGIPQHQKYHMGVVRWKLDPAILRWPANEGRFRRKTP